MYKAMDVACAIVNFANEIGHPISNLKLQKILYFVQGYYMQMKRVPFFDDEIEAWPYGPVVLNVYEQFQQYGANFIPSTYGYSTFSFEDLEFKENQYTESVFSKEDLSFIKSVVKKLNKYTASQLVTITHAQDPWKNAIKHGNRTIINKNSISEYFINRSKRFG